ncbi:MAG: hypothetical protein KC503_44905 [Myxococcales bacterium]|nr:hypothetical protein [Myxococcales bacterium]
MRARFLICVSLLAAGCEAETAPTVDAGPAREATTRDSADADSGHCELGAVVAELDALIRSDLDVCRDCHDATRPASSLQDPGPLWLVGNDAQRTFEQIVLRRLVDTANPLDSALLMRPLAVREGGWIHKGGDIFSRASEAYQALADFVVAAAPCVTASPR